MYFLSRSLTTPQVQALLNHASIETSARYFRAGPSEQAAVVESAFEQ
jgi:integrase/recombinase XerC